MESNAKFMSNKYSALANLVGEFTFGITHKVFYCENVKYSLSAHEYNHLMIGYLGGAQEFAIRTFDSGVKIVDRSELEKIFKAVYTDVLMPRDIEFAKNYKDWESCDTQEKLDNFDHRKNWSFRCPALEAYEVSSKIKK